MKISDLIEDFNGILDESFADTIKRFNDEGIDFGTIATYLGKFKDLTKRGVITGPEKDIGYWNSQGWAPFKKLIDDKENTPTNREIKKKAKTDIITVLNDDTWKVFIPTSRAAAILYGKNTRWCTNTEDSTTEYFLQYIKSNVLFYIINKVDGAKFACIVKKSDINHVVFFDVLDKEINQLPKPFTKKNFSDWARANLRRVEPFYIKAISASPHESYEYAMDTGKPFPQGEKAIASDASSSYNYAVNVLSGRFEAGEDSIAEQPSLAAQYAYRILKGRFPKAEEGILKDKIYGKLYKEWFIDNTRNKS